MLWEATHMNRKTAPAHKNCNRVPSFKPAHRVMTTPAPHWNRALTFLGTVSRGCSLLPCSFTTSYLSHLYSYSYPLTWSYPLLPHLVKLMKVDCSAQQNITHKQLINNKLLTITYSWSFKNAPHAVVQKFKMFLTYYIYIYDWGGLEKWLYSI